MGTLQLLNHLYVFGPCDLCINYPNKSQILKLQLMSVTWGLRIYDYKVITPLFIYGITNMQHFGYSKSWINFCWIYELLCIWYTIQSNILTIVDRFILASIASNKYTYNLQNFTVIRNGTSNILRKWATQKQ